MESSLINSEKNTVGPLKHLKQIKFLKVQNKNDDSSLSKTRGH